MPTITTPTPHLDTTALRTVGRMNARPRGMSKIYWYLFAAGLAVAVVGPVLLFFARVFENGGQAFSTVLDIPSIWKTLSMTVLLAVGSTLIGAVLAVALAVLALRVPPKLRSFARLVPML